MLRRAKGKGQKRVSQGRRHQRRGATAAESLAGLPDEMEDDATHSDDFDCSEYAIGPGQSSTG